MGLGVICAIAAGLLVHRERLDDSKAAFARLTEQRAAAVQHQVGRPIHALRALKALYAASQQVEEAEFVTFVDSWLLPSEDHHGSLLILGWIPVHGSDPAIIFTDGRSIASPGARSPDGSEPLKYLRGISAADELIVRTGVPFPSIPHGKTERVITLFAPLYQTGEAGAEQVRGHLFAVVDPVSLLHAAPSAASLSEQASLVSGEDTLLIKTHLPDLAALMPDQSLTASSALEFPGFEIRLEFIGNPKVYLSLIHI